MKFALLIGINYVGTKHELNGCINDVATIRDICVNNGYDDINCITDQYHSIQPTKSNIMDSIKNVLEKSVNGDTVLISYSGHGSNTRDLNGDEPDGKDEVVCAIDDNIKDDELYSLIVSNLKDGVKLRVIMDCCHSGSILDLNLTYNSKKNVVSESLNRNTSKDIIMISGCKDDQTSADAHIGGKYRGALTWAINKTLTTKGNGIKWKDLVNGVRNELIGGKYMQIPQLSFCNADVLDKSVDF